MGIDRNRGIDDDTLVLHHGANTLREDRRTARRFKVSVQVAFDASQGKGRAHVFDLGADGVFVCTAAPLEPGAAVDLAILIPGRKVIEVEGQVVWTNLVGTEHLPVGMGVRFIRIDPAARLHLRSHLTALA